MDKKLLFFALVAVALILGGCQSNISTVKVDPVSVPDRSYEVTVHETAPLYYAVLFDIPDDGIEVAMFYTYATNRVGMDTPEKYIDHLNTRVRGYKTLQISDRDGTVRGYLMVSNLLGYLVYERPAGERIIVMIGDPNIDRRGADVPRRLRLFHST